MAVKNRFDQAMEPFVLRFEEIGQAETRSLMNFGDPRLPKGAYGFLESYCNDSECDCRRVFLNVVYRAEGAAPEDDKCLATIGYGWESLDFYRKWYGEEDEDIIRDIKGPILEFTGYSSQDGDAILELFRENLLNDRHYIKRLERHYVMFKVKLDEETQKERIERKNTEKIGRNEPCPCGSGKKYKRCCMSKD